MKEYAGMVAAQTAQVLLMIVSKSAIADGISVNRPSLSFVIIGGFFVIGLLGFFAQIFGYTGISYSSATLATTLLNLIPGFTFILAVICRMETIKFGSSTTQAKFIGTVVSVAGAIMVTLYKGPPILSAHLKSEISKNLIGQPSNWVFGGIFLAIDAIFSSMYIIAQAVVLKKYPAEMIVMFSYCFVCTILSGLTSLIVEDDLSSYSLQHKKRLLSILYSGIFGSAFQVTVQAWCVRRRGPLFVAMFHPVGIVISTFIGVIFLGDGFYLGSLLGSIIVVIGFYSVMWGKANEEKIVAVLKVEDEQAPLLQDVEEQSRIIEATQQHNITYVKNKHA
ncbi:hypothetical protein R6Q57_013826 [Mikania cordata]